MIRCDHLTRRFGDFVAVDGISFEIPAGTACAFLGPNGAGKSTTLKMLTGLVRPSAGRAEVCGLDVGTQGKEVSRRIGVLPEDLGLFDYLTVGEHLTLTGNAYGLEPEVTQSRAEELLRFTGLEDSRRALAAECSHGMRKKTALAMALLPNPRALLLDEPFEGLDPVVSRGLIELLRSTASKGVTVFFTSHSLSAVEELASRLLIIREGRIVWDAPTAETPGRLEEHYFRLAEAPPQGDFAWLGLAPSSLP